MALWDRILHDAQLGPVKFPLSSRRVRGGRAFAKYRYPHRDGQEVIDTGRNPFVFELQVPLFAGVDPDHYPSRYESLRFILDDPENKGEEEYVDPFLGPLPVKVKTHDFDERAERRDGGVYSIVLEERTTLPFLVRELQDVDPQFSAEQAAITLDNELPQLGVSEGDITGAWAEQGVPLNGTELSFTAGALFQAQVSVAFDSLFASSLTVDDLANIVDRFRLRISIVLSFEAMAKVEAWSSYTASHTLFDSITRAGEQASQNKAPLMDWRVPQTMSHFEISEELYGTGLRAQEISDLNPTQRPLFYRAGAVLRVRAS